LKFRSDFDRVEVEDTLYSDHFQENVESKKRVRLPTSNDWDKPLSLVKFLVLFDDFILVVSASNSVSYYKCYSEIVTIERNLNHMLSVRVILSRVLRDTTKTWRK